MRAASYTARFYQLWLVMPGSRIVPACQLMRDNDHKEHMKRTIIAVCYEIVTSVLFVWFIYLYMRHQ